MHKRYGRYIYGKYGFVDAFNPSFDYDVPLSDGHRVRGVGWVATTTSASTRARSSR